jgi:peptidoglycan hydrolase CwlO-like protein
MNKQHKIFSAHSFLHSSNIPHSKSTATMPFPFGFHDLRLRADELEEENERLQALIRDRAELAVEANLRLRLAEANTKISVAQGAIKISELAKDLIEFERDNKDLKRTRDDLENEKTKLEHTRDDLENDKKNLERACDDLENDKKNLERARDDLARDKKYLELSLDTVVMDKVTLDRERTELLNKLQRASDSIDQKEKHIQHVESQAAKFKEELEAEQEKVRTLHEDIKKAKEQADGREQYITQTEGHAKGFEDQIKELELDKAYLNNQLAYERSERHHVDTAKGVLSTKYDKLLYETNNVRGQLDATQKENGRLKGHVDELKATITGLEHVQAEALEDRKIAQGLRLQWERMRNELPRFNPSPQAAIAPPPPPGPDVQVEQSKTQNLASELPLDFDRGSTQESNGESDTPTTTTTPSNGDPSDESSDGSSSSSSEDGDDADDDDCTEVNGEITEVITEVIREVIREVEVPSPPIRIYIPYQKTHHNPFFCWVLVEFNIGILFRNWLSYAAGRAAPLLRRKARTVEGASPNGLSHTPIGGGTPNGVSGTPSAPSPVDPKFEKDAELIQPVNGTVPDGNPSPNGASGTPFEPSPVDPKILEVANLVEPVVPSEDNRETYPSGEILPLDEHVHQPSSNANINPSNSPPVFGTLFAFALHLIFYYFLYVCYENYCERSKWISANETARKLAFDILALRGGDGRGLASHFFSEQVVRTIDRFVLTTVSLFKVETKAWQIPG